MKQCMLATWTQIRHYSSRTDLSKVRNIGIIAHIDAGKTTTTERMLYYSGKIKRIGNVDQGDTMTDFLPQERERGITIQSAAISFDWQKDHRINLIDTPGHADFTFEVIRALKVLDGCVTILDAVAGVEAQTEKVWRQSYGIPKICFVNKMDRVGAGFSRTVSEIITKLNTKVALVNIPFFERYNNEDKYTGVLDIVNQKLLKWDTDNPDKISVLDVATKASKEMNKQLYDARESLIETLSEYDEQLIEYFLEQAGGDYGKVPAKLLNESIRRATIDGHVVPILAGASFRNIGVQPLLDAVINYLPSPLEARLPYIKNNTQIPMKYDSKVGLIFNRNQNLCVALAFKVTTDDIRGLMVFVRVYSGVLKSGHTVYNTNYNEKFRIGKLVLMHANIPEEVSCLYPGEIGVLTGSTIVDKIRTGDTIVSHSIKKDGIKSLDRAKELSIHVNPITIPQPVFTASLEPRTLGNRAVMEKALKILIMEDPSLHIIEDEDTGQTLISGMGELHLEIAKNRLLNELKADVDMGKITVSYKETLDYSSSNCSYEDEHGYRFTLSAEPLPLNEKTFESNEAEEWFSLGTDQNYLVMEKNDAIKSYKTIEEGVWPYQLSYHVIVNAIMSSALAAFRRGGKIATLPLQSCAIRVHKDWKVPSDEVSPKQVLIITRNLMNKCLLEVPLENYSVIEPIMNLKVNVPNSDLGNVMQDLTSARNAMILSVDDHDGNAHSNGANKYFKIAASQYLPPDPTFHKVGGNAENLSILKTITARVPLSCMMSYNNKLRSLTKGRGSFYMEYYGVEKVVQNDRLEQLIPGA